LSNTYAESAGTFHDGKAAFHLIGTWDLVAIAMDQLLGPDTGRVFNDASAGHCLG
jgi:hypothetical protein